MTTLPEYKDNPSRLAALSRYRDLDYSSDSEFQTITELATEFCDASMSVITLVDENEVKFIFSHGIESVSCVPRDNAFCEKTVFQGSPLNIPDTLLDPEFKNNPLVKNEPHIRFYAGQPLITYDGHAIGTLCVLDTQPKFLSKFQSNSLSQLSKIATKLFESKLLESISRTNESFVQAIDEIVYDHDIQNKKIKWSGAYTRILGFNEEEMGSDENSWINKVHPDDLSAVLLEYEKVKKDHRLYDFEYRFAQQDGNYIWVHDRGVLHFDNNNKPMQTIGVIRDVHKRKLTELALQERETRYSTLVNNAIVCIHEIDLDGCFISMNPSGLNMLEAKNEEEIKGLSYLEGVDPKDNKRIKQLLDKALLGEKSTFEFTGTSGKIYASCFIPIKNTHGQVEKLMGVSEDITDRKLAELTVKEEKERLELVMRATNDCVWDLDKTTNTVWWNETYTKNFGRPSEENTWDWWLERIHPGDRERVKTSLETIPNTDAERWDEDYRFKKPNGEYCYVLDRAYIARDQSGNATRVLGAMSDITKQKRAEQDLREVNMALSHSMPGIARLDLDGHYTYVNEIYAALLGYTTDELIGQSWEITVDPSDIDLGKRGYQKMLVEDNVEFDIKGIKKDGSPLFKHVLISKRLDDNGVFIGHRCFMKDITTKVEVEQKHKQLQNELNHVARLSNMDEMATGLAHEINQPLTAISNYCDAAHSFVSSEPSPNSKLIELLQGASEQAHRAGEIVRHCRQFASKQPMEKNIVDLNELTNETVRFLDSDARDKKVEIQITLDKKIPPVKIDKVQIQQVLVNLLRNGIEAMQNNNGKVRKLSIYTHLNGKSSSQPEAQVTVKDTGQGLELSQIENLFQPFYTTKKNGMGMGLSISRTIISAHGGKLWFDNQEYRNTKFHFTLPIEKNEAL